jgi:hypothetical protein
MELDIDYEKAATDMKTMIDNPIDMLYIKNEKLKVCRFECSFSIPRLGVLMNVYSVLKERLCDNDYNIVVDGLRDKERSFLLIISIQQIVKES